MPTSKKTRKLERNLKLNDEDTVMQFPLPTDLVIPIIGATGSGKSALINTVLSCEVKQTSGVKLMSVGNTPEACTKQVQYAALEIDSFIKILQAEAQEMLQPLRGRRLILVDTPGFQDAGLGDVEVLRRISAWLAFSYHDGMKAAGAVYLHDITLLRANTATHATIEMFHVLCGNHALPRVILVSSKWDKEDPDVFSNREQWYKDKLWKPLIDLGSGTHRHHGFGTEPPPKPDTIAQARKSACDIIADVLGRYLNSSKSSRRRYQDHLKIQGELVERERRFAEVAACRVLVQELKATELRHKMMLKNLDEAKEEKAKEKDDLAADSHLRAQYEEALKEIQRQIEEKQKALKEIQRQIVDLKIPLGRQLLLGVRLA